MFCAFVSRSLIIDYWSIFMPAALKSLLGNCNIWFLLVSAWVDCLLSFKLWLSWFLVLWVIFDYILDTLVIMLGHSWAYLNLLFNQEVTLLGLACRFWHSLMGFSSSDHLVSWALAMLLCLLHFFWCFCASHSVPTDVICRVWRYFPGCILLLSNLLGEQKPLHLYTTGWGTERHGVSLLSPL